MPAGVYIRTPEHRELQRKKQTGKKLSAAHRKKLSLNANPYKRSAEHRAHQRALKVGKKNPKISAAMKGKKKSKAHRLALAAANRKENAQTYEQFLAKQYARIAARQLEQAGRPKPENCELCGCAGRICFDHDHLTGLFRGWICSHCNSALGMVKDNPRLLEKMAAYLRRQL